MIIINRRKITIQKGKSLSRATFDGWIYGSLLRKNVALLLTAYENPNHSNPVYQAIGETLPASMWLAHTGASLNSLEFQLLAIAPPWLCAGTTC